MGEASKTKKAEFEITCVIVCGGEFLTVLKALED